MKSNFIKWFTPELFCLKKGEASLGIENKGSVFTRISGRVHGLYSLLKQERLFKVFAVACSIVLFGALALFFFDRYYSTRGIGGLFDAIYWAIVTITTVGYGDIVPSSPLAKLAGLMIILSGPAVLSLVTASIASVLVERKIKEGKGLESVKDKDHVVICGWNENGKKVIDGIWIHAKGSHVSIVLINELDRDEVQSIQYTYKDHNLHFVRGNFVKEHVLARANLVHAKAAIVLADVSGEHSIEKADERTIFGTMAIKSMAPKVRTCAELIKGENREHLVRAKVDEIIVRGGSSGSMLATAVLAPGVATAITSLISNEDENKIWRMPAPSKYVGKPFGELSAHLREKFGALALAILKEESKITLDDILSSDSPSSIDDFIRKKFEASGKDFFGKRKDISVIFNPPNHYEISGDHAIIVVCREKPSEAWLLRSGL